MNPLFRNIGIALIILIGFAYFSGGGFNPLSSARAAWGRVSGSRGGYGDDTEDLLQNKMQRYQRAQQWQGFHGMKLDQLWGQDSGKPSIKDTYHR